MAKVKNPDDATPWHALSADAALEKAESRSSGLSPGEAAERLQQYGRNRLPEPVKRSVVVRFLLHFNNILIYVLLASAVVTAALGHLIDTLVILGVVVANAAIGFIQEGKAEKAMDAIRQMLAPRAAVLRRGERLTIEGEDLVPGDLVLLAAGDKVPADLRLVSVHGLLVQEAILTGESLPVEKHIRPVAPDAPLGDRACMAYSGTLVASGTAKGVVAATGARTEIGRISGMMSEVEVLTTPLVRQMDAFARWLTIFILLIAAMLLVFGYVVEHIEFGEMFMAVVGLSVAAIPEGLPAVLTITLAVGVQSMARRNAIVRRLPAIETLGSVSVICTDKTGTLTRNQMVVSTVATTRRHFVVEGSGYEPVGSLNEGGGSIDSSAMPVMQELGRYVLLCNDASLREHEGVWSVEGDPMEGALLALAAKTGIDSRDEHAQWPRTDAIPFDARHQFMATLHHSHAGQAFIALKGAPERLLAMCDRQRAATATGSEPVDARYWRELAEKIAAQGQRVLAVAVKDVAPEKTVLEFADLGEGLTLVGLVGMIDPPRAEAIAAVAECHQAGIRVKMITGDHHLTAMAIGKQVGLANFEAVLTGADLDALDEANLARAVLHTDIFARTSPEHKLRLVMALQSHGLTVAMTGDGVNDAPALKRADAGIAMGMKGSEAAKEASALVLADDNFASIVSAVREGRTVYDNIKKVISWTLPTNAGEAMTIIVALLMGMALPITPVQILWINLVTAVTLGLALAFEPTERGTMRRPPRPRNEPLLTGELVWHVVLVSTLFVGGVFGIYSYAEDRGYEPALARTMALNMLVVLEIFHLFFIRNIYGTSLALTTVRGTKTVWAMVLIVTAAQFAITYVPFLQGVFGTTAVPFWDGVIIVGIGVAVFAVIESEKQMRLRLRSMQAR